MPENVTPAGGQTEMVLGGTPPPNGAAGAQVPAPGVATPPAAAAAPAEKTPEQLTAEKKTADDAAAKTAADTKLADEKTAKDAFEKLWGEFKEPKVPEGYKLDAEGFKEFSTVAKELGLTPEKAQKFVDFQAKRDIASAKAAEAASAKYFADQKAEFLKASASDKEYAGKLEEATKVQQKAFEKFLGPEGLKDLAERHPNIAADPVLFKAFYRIGLAMKDDSISGALGGGVAAPGPQANLDRMYPSMKKS